jgi:cytochrome c oxidase subunit 2
MQHQIAWLVSLSLMAALAGAFAFVALNSGDREADYAPLQKRAYSLRARLFWALAVTLAPVMIYNLTDLPYDAAQAKSAAGAVQVVDAVGHQWYWQLSADHVDVGQTVEFRVTSADANHGFGIYDPDLLLVAQTQAMPGYTNTLRYTFSRKGTYKILCMEYCGVAHHGMIAEIQVGNP